MHVTINGSLLCSNLTAYPSILKYSEIRPPIHDLFGKSDSHVSVGLACFGHWMFEADFKWSINNVNTSFV